MMEKNQKTERRKLTVQVKRELVFYHLSTQFFTETKRIAYDSDQVKECSKLLSKVLSKNSKFKNASINDFTFMHHSHHRRRSSNKGGALPRVSTSKDDSGGLKGMRGSLMAAIRTYKKSSIPKSASSSDLLENSGPRDKGMRRSFSERILGHGRKNSLSISKSVVEEDDDNEDPPSTIIPPSESHHSSRPSVSNPDFFSDPDEAPREKTEKSEKNFCSKIFLLVGRTWRTNWWS